MLMDSKFKPDTAEPGCIFVKKKTHLYDLQLNKCHLQILIKHFQDYTSIILRST